jgi:hypothetical protein
MKTKVDRETVIRNVIKGQYEKPVRVVAFNTAEGWSRDITKASRAAHAAEPLVGLQ